MNSKNIVLVAFLAILLSSCDYQKQNKALKLDKSLEQKDLREGDKVVYGAGLDSAAAQTKNKYPSKPEYDARTQKIREKLASQR
jgi:hypothetical protein